MGTQQAWLGGRWAVPWVPKVPVVRSNFLVLSPNYPVGRSLGGQTTSVLGSLEDMAAIAGHRIAVDDALPDQ